MGRVLKSSASSEERFTVAIPALALKAAPLLDDDAFEGDEQAGFALHDNAADDMQTDAEPAIDLDAVRMQTQELIDDAARSAETLVDDAHERARVLIEDANVQAIASADDTRRTAHDEGYAAGVQAAHEEMTAMLDALRALLEATRAQRHAIIASAEPELVRLAVGIAERVLHQQVALDGGVVVEMARAAIARLVDRERLTVRVNPADIDRMRAHRDELLALGDVKTMRVIEDQRVDRGGVVVETDGGSIDAKISTQFAEVRKILHLVDDIVVAPVRLPDLAESELIESRAS